ncbi:MAG: transporter substrate-binding domain-containing protein [Cytophagaceae bacterium]|nr:transporter substrate-binding domain-containing protein [Gemmatimonadaceae bacterium]
MDDARAELAPTGVLRVALNHANFLLVSRCAPDAMGVAPDLGRELARRLGVAVSFVGYENAGLAADAAARNEWDVAFIGADPARERDVAFSPAYVEIDASFLVPPDSPITSIAEVDAAGVRIAVAERSAYDLFLRRAMQRATLAYADTIPASQAIFARDGLEALAGLKPRLLQDQRSMPGSRILDGRFMAVQQAIGTRRSATAGSAFVESFVRDILATGLVATLVTTHEVVGLTVTNGWSPEESLLPNV